MGYIKENGHNEQSGIGIGRGGSHMKKDTKYTFNKKKSNDLQNKEKKRGKNSEV